MKDKKINIEEIKLLLPDYISGNINPEDKKLVENSIENSNELRDLFNEMTGTLGFVTKVKFNEPDPMYWTNLLPRIHERIEKTEERKFSWEKVFAYWKIFVPVTAVIILAIIYFSVINNKDKSTITNKETEKINIETPKKIENNEKKEIVKETPDKTDEKKPVKIKQRKYENTDYEPAKEDVVKEDIKKIDSEDIAQSEIEDVSIFSGSTAGMVDEETDNDINRLSEREQDKLVEELIKINL